jgi:hypothetical protein
MQGRRRFHRHRDKMFNAKYLASDTKSLGIFLLAFLGIA